MSLKKRELLQIVPKSGAVISNHEGFNDAIYQKLKEDMKPQIAEAIVFGMTEENIQQLVKSIIDEFKKEH